MFNEQQLKTVERLLIAEREQTLDALGHHDEQMQDLRERAGEISLYRFHPADIGSEEHEQEKDFMITSMEGGRLYQIDEALNRLYKDPENFGRCARCDKDIEWERLEVIPETTLCAEHARALDEETGAADAADPREASRAGE
jgi:RNA polymerase-binding transcription factor DksA